MTTTPSTQARAVEVTQADRELFISLWQPTDELAEDVRNGRAFTGEVEEIARHRTQAEADALEMAARPVAASALQTACETDPADPDHPDAILLTTGDFETIVRCAIENYAELQAAIRAMKGQQDHG